MNGPIYWGHLSDDLAEGYTTALRQGPKWQDVIGKSL